MIAAVVLAAGGSARLGQPKQLLRLNGQSLLRHVTRCAVEGGCDPVVVVLGARAGRIEPELEGLGVQVVRNPRWREGLGGSIRVGIETLEGLDVGVEAALLLGCDQPRISPEVVRTLCQRFDGTPGRMVAASYAGTVGIPALFERRQFGALCGLTGDRGAREILRSNEARILKVDWPDGAFDIDRPEDLASDGRPGRPTL